MRPSLIASKGSPGSSTAHGMTGQSCCPGSLDLMLQVGSLMHILKSVHGSTGRMVAIPVNLACRPAPSKLPGAEPFASAGQRTAGGSPLHFMTFSVHCTTSGGRAPGVQGRFPKTRTFVSEQANHFFGAKLGNTLTLLH